MKDGKGERKGREGEGRKEGNRRGCLTNKNSSCVPDQIRFPLGRCAPNSQTTTMGKGERRGKKGNGRGEHKR